MVRRLLIGLFGLLAVALLASFLAWRWVEGRVAQGFDAWTQAIAADGWTVHAGAPTRGGWPLAVEFSVDDFSLTGGDSDLPGGADYAAERLTLRLDPRRPTVLSVRGEGHQSVRVGPLEALPFTADRLALSIPLTRGRQPTSAALDAAGLRFAAPAEGLTIGLLEGQADWHRADASAPPATNFRLSAEAITLPPPPAAQAPLGPRIASATVEGTLSGALPSAPPSPAAAAAGWRASGGALLLRGIAVGWGPLGVSGSASLTLDAALQPEATATLRLIGMPETLSALADAHVITPRAAQAAKAVAGLLTHAPEGGGTPGVEVPLTLRDRTIALGMIPLATVGKLHWPDGP
jgi:hypothetical protein